MGVEEGDKGPEAENSPVRVCVWGVQPCPVLAFPAAVRLREEIRALRCLHTEHGATSSLRIACFV